MQLAMIGLGRMGASRVRRLVKTGHDCIVYDMQAAAVEVVKKDGATGALSLQDMVAKMTRPRALWLMLPAAVVDRNNTFMVGIGARVRIRPTVYIVVEASPRASGYKPGVSHGSFGIEKRAGGHMFQLNFSDSFGTTLAQIARGGPVGRDWFMGFNISRKFF